VAYNVQEDAVDLTEG